MEWNFKKSWPLAALSFIGMASSLSAARNNSKEACEPTPPAPCYTVDEPACQYCLGPEEVNPAVRPKTCNGDFVITVAGFYWNANQDGMEYALETGVRSPDPVSPSLAQNQALNNLIEGHYQNPKLGWDFGFKLGLGYNHTCDGWDFGVVWTRYQTSSHTEVEAEQDDNKSLLPIWSDFAPTGGGGGILFATDIETRWKLNLDVVDIELGREFWTSKYLTMRPFVGLRLAWIRQNFDIEHSGGSWSVNTGTPASQDADNNFVDIQNKYHGVGLRAGLGTVWNLGRGWGIFGDFAFAILYGRFNVDHNEYNRKAIGAHEKHKVLETHNSFRASRGTSDVTVGLQWSTLFDNCRYGFTAKLGWEHHMFFDQNQMWRVMRIGDTAAAQPNLTGENVYHERRGDLSTQGWTLTLVFEF